MTSPSNEHAPVAFLSYSWSSREYADRVLQLAHDLSNDGIVVILDQWNLAEGQDKHAFMEKTVLDPQVDRVLILVDPRYVERANRREGGVGVETSIISGGVYTQVDQQKFVAVVMERDPEGRITLPIYLQDRIYIDLSDAEHHAEQYERLIRNLHGKPERVRPQLGKRPSYLDSNAPVLTTGQALPMFRNALMQDRPGTAAALEEYLDRFFSAFAAEAIDVPRDFNTLEQLVSDSITRFLPYRDEFIGLLQLLARHGRAEELIGRMHALFERMVTFRMSLPTKHWSSEYETENLSFITWELFLYATGTLIRQNQMSSVERLLRPYYVRSQQAADGALTSFDVIDTGFPVLQEARQRRLGTNWYSAAAQLLSERSDAQGFEMLSQADSVLWVRSMFSETRGDWSPRTSVYRPRGWSGLPVWARARGDQAYFRDLAPVLGVVDMKDARNRLEPMGDHAYVHIGNTWLGKSAIVALLGLRDD